MKKVFIISKSSATAPNYFKRDCGLYQWTSKIREASFFYTKQMAERIVHDMNEPNETVLEIRAVFVSKILVVAKKTV